MNIMRGRITNGGDGTYTTIIVVVWIYNNTSRSSNVSKNKNSPCLSVYTYSITTFRKYLAYGLSSHV